MSKSPVILIAPLNWGLGHATRCIPLITCLVEMQCNVIIAADGPALTLLQNQFPKSKCITFSGYKIEYSKKQKWLPVKLVFQIPKILLGIFKEHQQLQKAIEKYSISAVISDNRFGLFSKKAYSIYITHQLQIKTGNLFSEKVLLKIHYWFIKKFNECWVPDYNGVNNIAGELSHPAKLPQQVSYIGCLSRFTKNAITDDKLGILILLSGPEPQRSILESIIIPQLQYFDGSALLVRGLPEADNLIGVDKLGKIISSNKNVQICNYLNADDLNKAIEKSLIVVARAGFSTIMDLIKLKKKAILIPTPSQTEQEYLGRYMQQRKFFYCVPQENFSLQQALAKASAFEFSPVHFEMDIYQKQLQQFLTKLDTLKTIDG